MKKTSGRAYWLRLIGGVEQGKYRDKAKQKPSRKRKKGKA